MSASPRNHRAGDDQEAHASTHTVDDVRFMRRAIALAERGAGQVAPNPKVGAVLVRDGQVVGEGWHQQYGGPHAEVHALAAAHAVAANAARGATAYVSLEPCNHHGKTPPCTEALIAAGVARVVCATRDPNPKAAGGIERLEAAGIRVTVGVCEHEALVQNAPFFHAARGTDRPFVTLKLAVSIDGAIVDASRQRGWLTGPAAHAAVHALRADADAVAVGIGTALADDPALTVRLVEAPRVAPRRIVFDRQGRLPLDSALVRTAGEIPVSVITHAPRPVAANALADAGVQVLEAAGLADALRTLWAEGVRHLLVEGGAELGSALLHAGLVHHLIIFQAPVILGAGAVSAFATFPAAVADTAPRLRVLERRVFGDDLMTRYAVFGD
ncbi:diaminohydroxyphosphoribosylaminopyrimidine deaminase/5-amino-6-(5-phosphoribosylamino)uracil reductase [Gemmatimonas aurantiaca T-27]|uniref:Riboflavin biosynthesis protein RibD n=2 Tax=Gemmatimonas aurantiaca TaxID=173480 RepID=C1A8F3_GEMAT|nr:bifunctional diaminohydroxyphosphoribosylaminopyrimidine deaminase/5-amino-6-(5-phosphoribosylamino)uracil reductase RibD [Gemmatimonas aurantiaca]BAH38513.1 diaminohydroxyphosphoribosylaminopyrimidine deaminase/5-amino-6-(5-phosphoribosylamino)uracil reductase [Gemmatimonas aurantiaca T-27]